MIRTMAIRGLQLFASIAIVCFGRSNSANELMPLKYNNPGLVVDLGVGLWAWPIPCDADGDGDYDLIVSCPDKPSNGLWVFENATGDTAKEKLPVFKAGRHWMKTTKYVMPSYTTNGMRVLSPGSEFTDFLNKGIETKVSLPIAANFHKPKGTQPKGPKVRHNQWRYVDYDGDGVQDLSVGIEDWSYYGWDDAWDAKGNWVNGPLHGWVYIFRNQGTDAKPVYDKPFFVKAAGERLDVFGCPSQNFEDFDKDGDLDLICGEFLDSFTYFENVGTRKKPEYAAGVKLSNTDGDRLAMDLEMIVPIAFDWDKDGDCDLIVGDEDGRVAFVENVRVEQNRPVFAKPIYFRQEADTLKCGALASPCGFDWDGDGDIDIVSGNTAGYVEFFENLSGPNVAEPQWNAPVKLKVNGRDLRIMAGPNGSIQGPAEAKWGYTTLTIADWDRDQKPDLIVNSILGRVVWYRNQGSRTKPVLADPQAIEVDWQGEQPKLGWGWLRPDGDALLTQWRTTPLAFDFNRDGLVDLGMLDQEGYLAYFERNDENGKLGLKSPRRAFLDEEGKPLRLNAGTAGKSGRRKLCVSDWNGDGKFDLLMNSSNADLWEQIDEKDGVWRFRFAGTLAEKNIEGHDVSPTVVDFDGNGVSDFVGGAEDGRMYYLKNPRSGGDLSFSNEFIYESAPFPSCHASTIVEANDGTLVAAWFGGTREKDPDVGIWLSRKVNGRWTTPTEVANGVKHMGSDASVARYPTWNPVLFQPKSDSQASPLMLFYKVGPDPERWWGMVMQSQDSGQTWSEPTKLPDGILGPIRNKPIQLGDGAILSPSSTESIDRPRSRWQVYFERSADLGKTWTKTAAINDGIDVEAIQPALLSLGNNRIMAYVRTRQNRAYFTTSSDAGKTWSSLQASSLPNNNSGLDAVTMSDGRHALVYNHISGTPGKWGGKRTPLNLAISSDGIQWEAAFVLEKDPGEYSYPAIIQSRDGKLHITYTWKREKVRHWTIDPASLKLEPIVNGEWPRNL